MHKIILCKSSTTAWTWRNDI